MNSYDAQKSAFPWDFYNPSVNSRSICELVLAFIYYFKLIMHAAEQRLNVGHARGDQFWAPARQFPA